MLLPPASCNVTCPQGCQAPHVLQAGPSHVVGTLRSAHAFGRGCVPRGTAGAGKCLRLETGSWVPVKLWIPRGCFGEAPGVLQEWRTHSGLPNEDGAGNGTEDLMGTSPGKVLLCSEVPSVKPAPKDSPGKWSRGAEQASCHRLAAPPTLLDHLAMLVGALGHNPANQNCQKSGGQSVPGRLYKAGFNLCVPTRMDPCLKASSNAKGHLEGSSPG